MGYNKVVAKQDGAREKTLSREYSRLTPECNQSTTQPRSDTSFSHSWRYMGHLSQAAIVTLLIALLVAASALGALLTYWIGH